jgi:hypothetical protein
MLPVDLGFAFGVYSEQAYKETATMFRSSNTRM